MPLPQKGGFKSFDLNYYLRIPANSDGMGSYLTNQETFE